METDPLSENRIMLTPVEQSESSVMHSASSAADTIAGKNQSAVASSDEGDICDRHCCGRRLIYQTGFAILGTKFWKDLLPVFSALPFTQSMSFPTWTSHLITTKKELGGTAASQLHLLWFQHSPWLCGVVGNGCVQNGSVWQKETIDVLPSSN